MMHILELPDHRTSPYSSAQSTDAFLVGADIRQTFLLEFPPLSENDIANAAKLKISSLYPGPKDSASFSIQTFHGPSAGRALVHALPQAAVKLMTSNSSKSRAMTPFDFILAHHRKGSAHISLLAKWIEYSEWDSDLPIYYIALPCTQEEGITQMLDRAMKAGKNIVVWYSKAEEAFLEQFMKLHCIDRNAIELHDFEAHVRKVLRRGGNSIGPRKDLGARTRLLSIIGLVIINVALLLATAWNSIKAVESEISALELEKKSLAPACMEAKSLISSLGDGVSKAAIRTTLHPFELIAEIAVRLPSDTVLTAFSYDKESFRVSGLSLVPIKVFKNLSDIERITDLRLQESATTKTGAKVQFSISGRLGSD